MPIALENENIFRLAREYWKTHACATTEEVISHIATTYIDQWNQDALKQVRMMLNAPGTSSDLVTERRYDDVVEQSFPASDPPQLP